LAEVLKTKNNMKKNSALKKMPDIVKGAGGYTYKYTSSEEMSDIKHPGPLKPAVYYYPKLEVKGPNSNTFTTVDKNTPAYESIMKEISPKLTYDKKKFEKIKNSPELSPVTKMKRRSDGSMAKLKGQSFMKRMKMMNEASPIEFGPKRKTTKKKLPVDPLDIGGKITKTADVADKEMKNLISNIKTIAKTDVPRKFVSDVKNVVSKFSAKNKELNKKKNNKVSFKNKGFGK